jgi:hypothetical protein
VAWSRWYKRGHYKASKLPPGSVFNVWLGKDGIIEAIIKHPSEHMVAFLMCGLEHIV